MRAVACYLNLFGAAEPRREKAIILRLRLLRSSSGFGAAGGLGCFFFNALLRFLAGVYPLGVVPLGLVFHAAASSNVQRGLLAVALAIQY